MGIWFRIEHDHGDLWVVHAKVGRVEFKSALPYKEDELPAVVRELSRVDHDDEDSI